MKPAVKYLIVAVVVVAAGAATVLLKRSHAEAKPEPAASNAKTALTVKLVQPQQRDWNSAIRATGVLAAWQEAVIAAETGSLRITTVQADVGSQVKRGQVLATLDTAALHADIAKHQAVVAQMQAALSQARSDADRARVVKTSGSLSEQAITQYMVAEQTAQANLASAQADLQNDTIRLQQTEVRAVDDGVISSRSALLGNVVSTGSELFRMVRQNRIEWRAEVAPGELSGIAPGQAALVTLPGGVNVHGKVRIVSPTLSNDTRLALVYVDLERAPGVKAGLYSSGSITTGQRSALTLPAAAVTARDGQHYVFTLLPRAANKPAQVRQTLVSTGRQQGDLIEITHGLNADAQVVASGGAFLGDGDLVTLAAPAPATAVQGKAQAATGKQS
ncbi:efflux RND transporter periplasmic adaptor subunit [Amantichitinum ursilacus]|uniref:p-hydroxybenzoic acid efflux pump subunit AaeA n=1 Tax=Amantichitinum ursilacus TaxID=857265 RepID=A0A0N0XIB3_9NEIS|nr:efflux RND transporter periplasmic adaptor subunit [Amantichitinum ursilacus]KPC52566.1 p-hydroxybenzoic acid efflux pump subunit AaeA [Amantichitinum ursilacus]